MTEEIGPAAFLVLGMEVRDLWPEASRQRIDDILPRHAERDGFRAVIERTGVGALAGFAYGYRGAPGQWWHDLVADALGPDGAARWLAPGHFELVELHVHAALWGRGIGGRLHDALLAPEAGPAVLSTQRDNERALVAHLLAAPVDGRLFFAGEATSSHFCSTAHGARDSGERAAAEVIATLTNT